ncbi:saccharopine dehydrogenase NADP-binding domain-containing protein [Rhodobiaceae bacterium]|nr:saccharopine dehydrogenase NADP-binding domain-containing protein [Rhodobiaceae bacterium]|tara:strand:+ start:1934 stop:3121 length:1188 start_codon:yes stop_codon:yes gene_type:complete
MEKNLDIVVYGATGFTGKLCAKYLSENSVDLNWAIAGRNKEKLEELKKELSLDVDIFIAESNDEKALDNITKNTKVVLSTAGPFHRYSSNLVKSCVKNSSDYVDITGEFFWIREMIDLHHEEASSKGVRIIPACGYDSIPSDLGTFFSSTKIKEPIKRIESFHAGQGGVSGGTTETGFSMGDLKLGKKMNDPFVLNPEKSVSNEQKLLSSDSVGIKKNNLIESWTGPFIMAVSNTRVVRRSAALLELNQEGYGVNFTYQEHAFYKKFRTALLVTFVTLLFGLILSTPIRKLVRPLLPKPGEGPSEETMENGFFDSFFTAELDNGEKKLFRVHGKGDPGYKVTSKFVCESALTLVKDREKLPGGNEYGGVLTPASGLGQPLIDRLSSNGVHFEGPL